MKTMMTMLVAGLMALATFAKMPPPPPPGFGFDWEGPRTQMRGQRQWGRRGFQGRQFRGPKFGRSGFQCPKCKKHCPKFNKKQCPKFKKGPKCEGQKCKKAQGPQFKKRGPKFGRPEGKKCCPGNK